MSTTDKGPTVAISLTVKDTAAALDFYTRAFGAEELYRIPNPGNKGVAHAEFMIGNSRVYISDESPEWHAFALPDDTKAPCLFAIAVDECDAAYEKAAAAGAESLLPPENQFWGIRSAMVQDPFGYRWALGQMVEEVSAEEMARRAKELFGE